VLPLESVPNFSEGRDAAVIGSLVEAVERHAKVLDVHSDVDHNRSVITFVGEDEDVVDALVSVTAEASRLIDLRSHEGAHPRVGATDVAPVVPLRPEDMERAKAAAFAAAYRIADEVELPVFLYGELAPGRGPAFFRRGGSAELRQRIEAGELAPDFGPGSLDERAGCVLVGARRPLIAFNVDLAGADLETARAVAACVREANGGFPGVRALGLALPRSGRVQVSMNVEDWEAAAIGDIVARIEEEAVARGASIAGSELVGLMPAGAAAAAAARTLRIDGFDASRVLEVRLLG
jgi:glutamate formiminotransferase